jgi:hypothetical protein
VRGGGGRAGDDFFGADESAAGKVAGGYCLSREEDYILFSAGDFGGGERGVVDFDVFDWEVEAVMAFVFFPSLLGTGQKP